MAPIEYEAWYVPQPLRPFSRRESLLRPASSLSHYGDYAIPCPKNYCRKIFRKANTHANEYVLSVVSFLVDKTGNCQTDIYVEPPTQRSLARRSRDSQCTIYYVPINSLRNLSTQRWTTYIMTFNVCASNKHLSHPLLPVYEFAETQFSVITYTYLEEFLHNYFLLRPLAASWQ
jgi:hypothetical protein